MTNTGKQTSEEKQAKKKELDHVTLRGGALEMSWSEAEGENEGPGNWTPSNCQATLFLILLTVALRNGKVMMG